MTDSDQSDTTVDAPDEQEDPTAATTEARGLEQAGEESDTDDEIISATLRRTLYRGTFLALALFGLFAAVQFYLNASRAISVWVVPDYQPLFQAAFNLVVVLACGLGLTVLVERFR